MPVERRRRVHFRHDGDCRPNARDECPQAALNRQTISAALLFREFGVAAELNRVAQSLLAMKQQSASGDWVIAGPARLPPRRRG